MCFDIFVKYPREKKSINTFWNNPGKQIVIQILKFVVHFVANIGKMMIIFRTITNNMRVLLLYFFSQKCKFPNQITKFWLQH